MEYHPTLGIAVPELGWVPAPRYLFRRDRILRSLAASPKGVALDIGCGAGALLKDLRNCGFDCVAMETSSHAAEIARTVHNGDPGVEIVNQPQSDWTERFDLGLACEVLEHIEDASAALTEWVRWIKPGGRFIISVPGRPEKWDATDVWAGHFRRYTRESLETLCSSAGLKTDKIESYGFPIVNWVTPIRARRLAKSLAQNQSGEEMAKATAESGIDRNYEVGLYPYLRNPLGRSVIRIGCQMQRCFLDGNRGLALLAWATKP